jgi:hypothetical protein
VILSSASQLELRDGKTYHTGYYLDELAVPLRKIVDAGYTPVFANPKGNAVSFDPASNSKVFFGGDDAVRRRPDGVLLALAGQTRATARGIPAGLDPLLGKIAGTD